MTGSGGRFSSSRWTDALRPELLWRRGRDPGFCVRILAAVALLATVWLWRRDLASPPGSCLFLLASRVLTAAPPTRLHGSLLSQPLGLRQYLLV